LLIATWRYTIHGSIKVFGNTRHLRKYDNPENLISILREYIPPNITIGVHCTLEDFYRIQKPLKDSFINTFLYTKTFVQDAEDAEDRSVINTETHCRAHRGLDENYKQITILYYWPNLYKKLKEFIKNCTICNQNKYNRHLVQIPIGQAPIPEREGENIYYAQNLKFITCIDSYPKYLVVKEIPNKLNIETKVSEIVQHFPLAKYLMIDNEPSFSSSQFKSFFSKKWDISILCRSSI